MEGIIDMTDQAEMINDPAPKKRRSKKERLADAGIEGRADAYKIDPDRAVIIGLDTDDGEEHELYDERIHLPLSPEMVANIKAKGVIEPIQFIFDGDRIVIVNGRRRIMHAREANRQLVAEGEPPLRVPGVSKSDEHLLGLMVSTNEHRVDDTPLTRAKKLQRMIARGYSLDECAVYFGVSKQTIRNWKALLECAPKVQKAVDAGKISASAAQKLAKLERAEQVETLDKMIESGETGHKDAARHTKARSEGTSTPEGGEIEVAPRPPGKRVWNKLVEHWGDEQLRANFDDVDINEDVIKGIRLALGDLTPKSVKGLTKELKALGWKG